jgi:hypothetical protein
VPNTTPAQWWGALPEDDRLAFVQAVDCNELSPTLWSQLARANVTSWQWRDDRTDTAFYLPARFRRHVLNWANEATA